MKRLLWGGAPIRNNEAAVRGDLVRRDGEKYYRIANYDQMPAFFISVVSGFDHWLFVSSKGGLTCGRKSPNGALFPYYTDDKIHDACSTTGPQTALRVDRDGETFLWKPFSQRVPVYDVERNLYKNQAGNRLVFEEINRDLELIYSYSWSPSERFGFVKKSSVRNTGSTVTRVELLDGLRNVLPYGVPNELQTSVSTLVDAYKQAERIEGFNLGVYTMSSILTDRAEPSEALKATVVWSSGLDNPCILLSEDQFPAFCRGKDVIPELFSNGKRCAFYVRSMFSLPPDGEKSWVLVADVNQGPSDVPRLLAEIGNDVTLDVIEKDVDSGTQRLRYLAGSSDGCQLSSDDMATGRHFSNTMFNIMRGGTFYDEYRFPIGDFQNFLGTWNAPLRDRLESLITLQDDSQERASVLADVAIAADDDLERIALEYLPLTFSRRHGDPSRPWNHFSIDIKNEDGTDRLSYQGNWRDIFQNWEALAISYPEFIESFVTKFVNASTADGYNPYRISKSGFEWEVLDSEDPWSNIGYWGDHQVNYLLSFLELSRRYHPGSLSGMLSREMFVYADVPYRLKGHQALLKDPRNSVKYDAKHAAVISRRVTEIGADGRLVCLADGSIHRVSLLEKLLVTLLVKVGNFSPGGGIWMNTQRPEWNDANNALVGYGLSMVTLCYLRQFLIVLDDLLKETPATGYSVSEEVARYFHQLQAVLQSNSSVLEAPVSPVQRKVFMDSTGKAGEEYRGQIYAGFSGKKEQMEQSSLLEFINLTLKYMDESIAANRRDDGLFHSYNLIHFGEDGYGVEHLYEMLEGQVAVLKSGFLCWQESVSLLDSLRASKLYRPDQNSYLLYPSRKQKSFLDKNLIPRYMAENNPWILNELSTGRRTFVESDIEGNVHFNPYFRNASELSAVLKAERINKSDSQALFDIYESVFNHREFTGRSGTMYKYEGLGCIYWHMVSKLLLATGDIITREAQGGVEQAELGPLLAHFDQIKAGLGLNKSPAQYGAFLVDPYSHTPAFTGVQQPGMTGQVKEDFITRFTELGVSINGGEIMFAPVILQRCEFLSEPEVWSFPMGAVEQNLDVDAGSLAFSLCGIPVIYRLAGNAALQVVKDNGEVESLTGNRLGKTHSRSVFQRDKRIQQIIVDVPESRLR